VEPVPAPDILVARASAIVVATAARYHILPAPPGRGIVEFHVEEILRGDVPPLLLIEGTLGQRDDFNDRTPPYDFVRPNGRHGSCFADEYREGARFLLLLGPKADGSLTPYWEALAPTNEQLHPGNDPWLTAVRRFVTAAGRR
jgi:hypothetical protein